jgi:hypothetical protein
VYFDIVHDRKVTHPFSNFLSTGIRIGTRLAPVRQHSWFVITFISILAYYYIIINIFELKNVGTAYWLSGGTAASATMLLCNLIV